ncbi:hypothetical protein Kpho01_46000 [Kitasatospora phosalacinea]|uniref:Putative restriction endonuclease domain-containing protein n=1 Tax=Kitasatospora phosalacinea TaxID=2065 RepID=A0A9W6PI50_9ACTN|nr:hypothetical protein Kpho01_46000 [Kitasatospora phosalacinea]
MTAETYDADVHRSPEDVLLGAFLALDTPEGFKAELVEGEIIVTPPPDGDHEGAIGRIVRQVFRLCDADITFAGNKGLIVPGGRFIPDGTFADEGAFDGQPSWMKPDRLLMVLEVTSSNPAKDRRDKPEGLRRSGDSALPPGGPEGRSGRAARPPGRWRVHRHHLRPVRGPAAPAEAVRVRPGDGPAGLSRSGWRDARARVRRLCKTARVSSLSLIISSRRAGPQ